MLELASHRRPFRILWFLDDVRALSAYVLLGILFSEVERRRLHYRTCLQGQTGRLEKLPQQLLQGQRRVTDASGACLFLSTLDQQTASWCLSWKAPQTLAAQLNMQLREPDSAKVPGLLTRVICMV